VVVREYLRSAPWWVLSLVIGAWTGVFYGLFEWLSGQPNPVLSGVVFGTFFGLVMGPMAVRLRARQEAAIGQLPRDIERAAWRAAQRGPRPDNWEVRYAALRVARYHLSLRTRRSRVFVWVFGLLIALIVYNAVTVSPASWLFVVVLVGLLGFHLWRVRHLRARIVFLEDPNVGTDGGLPIRG
jgi:xanthosine utilization system XapX-like protein